MGKERWLAHGLLMAGVLASGILASSSYAADHRAESSRAEQKAAKSPATAAEFSSDKRRVAGGEKTGSLSETDRSFVRDAAAASAAAIAMGRIAAKKGVTSQVRQFGSLMVKDHSKTQAELRKLASSRGINVRDEPTSEQGQNLEKLSKLSGSKFDFEYIKVQHGDHEKALELFRRQAENGGDPGLKQFAATALPTLEAHKKKVDLMR